MISAWISFIDRNICAANVNQAAMRADCAFPANMTGIVTVHGVAQCGPAHGAGHAGAHKYERHVTNIGKSGLSDAPI